MQIINIKPCSMVILASFSSPNFTLTQFQKHRGGKPHENTFEISGQFVIGVTSQNKEVENRLCLNA